MIPGVSQKIRSTSSDSGSPNSISQALISGVMNVIPKYYHYAPAKSRCNLAGATKVISEDCDASRGQLQLDHGQPDYPS